LAGLFSVALVVVLFFGKKKTPGRYPARCPSVFGLSSVARWTKAITRLASILQGLIILTKKC